jgi:hypothetical protein
MHYASLNSCCVSNRFFFFRKLELRRLVLDRLVYLLSLGHVVPVLSYIHSIASTTDISLVCHFVTEVSRMMWYLFVSSNAPYATPGCEHGGRPILTHFLGGHAQDCHTRGHQLSAQEESVLCRTSCCLCQVYFPLHPFWAEFTSNIVTGKFWTNPAPVLTCAQHSRLLPLSLSSGLTSMRARHCSRLFPLLLCFWSLRPKSSFFAKCPQHTTHTWPTPTTTRMTGRPRWTCPASRPQTRPPAVRSASRHAPVQCE